MGAAEDDASSDTSADPVEVVSKLRKYVQLATGSRVRDAGIQTGGPEAWLGKLVGGKKKKKNQTGADIISKMRVSLDLLAGLATRPYLRELLMNYAVHTAGKCGQPALALKGQKIRRVSEGRLLAERKVLEENDPERGDKMCRKLEAVCKEREKARTKQEAGVGPEGYLWD